ncbi:14-3-3-like protein D isoform X1 [Tanacetum coccineum]
MVAASKRVSWRILSLVKSLEEEIGDNDHVSVVAQKMKTLEREITDTCHEIVATIDDHLLKSQNTPEVAVFYLKMKGDYYHYLAKFKSDAEKEEAKSQAEKAYEHRAEKDLAPNDPVRLGLALNFSVFHYDMPDSTHRYLLQWLRQQRPAPAAATAPDPASSVSNPLNLLMGSLTCAAVICDMLSRSVEAVTKIILKEKKNQAVYDAAVGASFVSVFFLRACLWEWSWGTLGHLAGPVTEDQPLELQD